MIPISPNWSDSRVLITGASGFIGTHLAQELLGNGVEVHGVSRSNRPTREGDIRWWQADLSSYPDAKTVLARIRPDVVYHLSSLADGRRGLALVLPILHSEVVATVNTLTAATEIGVKRFILAGSLEEPFPGDAPSSPYAAAKAASRCYGSFFCQVYGTPVVFTRIFMAYGPGQSDRKIIPYCALSLLRREIPRIDSAHRQVDWIYVSDVVQGLVRIGQAPDLEGQTLDLGSGTLTPISEIVRQIQRLVGGRVDFSTGSRRGDEQVRCADVAATTARTGWSPRISLEDGLKRTIAVLEATCRT